MRVIFTLVPIAGGSAKKLFGSQKVECPRCLGKGFVDKTDIKRLEQEFFWNPGPCAYCNSDGLVNSETAGSVAPNNTYLTIERSETERRRILNNDPGAMQRGNMFKSQLNQMVHGIIYLYFSSNMSVEAIAEFYLMSNADELRGEGAYDAQKSILEQYIRNVIDTKNSQESL